MPLTFRILLRIGTMEFINYIRKKKSTRSSWKRFLLAILVKDMEKAGTV